MTTTRDIVSQIQTGRLEASAPILSQPWSPAQHVRAYQTLSKGYFPGMLWLWWPREIENRVVLDGVQRIESLMLLFGFEHLETAAHGGSRRAQFNPDNGLFRVVNNVVDSPVGSTDEVWVDTAPLLQARQRDVPAIIASLLAEDPLEPNERRMRRRLALGRVSNIANVEVPCTTVDLPSTEILELLAAIHG